MKKRSQNQCFVQPNTYSKRPQPNALAKEYNPSNFLGQEVAKDLNNGAAID